MRRDYAHLIINEKPDVSEKLFRTPRRRAQTNGPQHRTDLIAGFFAEPVLGTGVIPRPGL
jgi:hypothetical protein